jgi:hypothetical protein
LQPVPLESIPTLPYGRAEIFVAAPLPAVIEEISKHRDCGRQRTQGHAHPTLSGLMPVQILHKRSAGNGTKDGMMTNAYYSPSRPKYSVALY